MSSQKVLDKAEADLLVYLLSLTGQPRVVKSALQRLCELLEQKTQIGEPTRYRATIIGLIWQDDILVRRWATKAITLIGMGSTTNLDVLFLRLRTEPNFENRAWLIAAIGKLARRSVVRDVCVEAGVDYYKEYELAARLFSHEHFESLGDAFVNIENDSEEVLLWISLIEGYERAPEHLAHQKLENVEVIRQLNSHPDEKVAEYSIWSLWHHSKRSAANLTLNRQDYPRQPAAIRRWIYRLQAKTPQTLLQDRDFFQTLYSDKAAEAREGLALGLRNVRVNGGTTEMLNWIQQEEVPAITELLYEHLARNSDAEEGFATFVKARYQEEQLGSPFRNRMMSACSGTSLLGTLRRIDLEDASARLRRDVAEPQGLLLPQKGTHTVVNVFGNVGNLSMGDQTIKAGKLVQDFSSSGIDAAMIAEVLAHATKVLNPVLQAELAQEINDFVDHKSPEVAKSLKDRLISLSETVTAGGKVAGAFDKLIEIVQGIAGS